MIRVRIPGGVVTPGQWLAMDKLIVPELAHMTHIARG